MAKKPAFIDDFFANKKLSLNAKSAGTGSGSTAPFEVDATVSFAYDDVAKYMPIDNVQTFKKRKVQNSLTVS